MKRNTNNGWAGMQYSFRPPAAAPRTKKYRMETIFETAISGTYPEHLTWKDFENGERFKPERKEDYE